MSKKNTGGPAFPNASIKTKEGIDVWGEGGMTLRDYFAAKAMQALIDNDGLLIPRQAYAIADAMLAAREKA